MCVVSTAVWVSVWMYFMHIKYECVYVYMCVCSLHDVHVLCWCACVHTLVYVYAVLKAGYPGSCLIWNLCLLCGAFFLFYQLYLASMLYTCFSMLVWVPLWECMSLHNVCGISDLCYAHANPTRFSRSPPVYQRGCENYQIMMKIQQTSCIMLLLVPLSTWVWQLFYVHAPHIFSGVMTSYGCLTSQWS